MQAKRTRAGSWKIFERRFRPVAREDGSLLWDRPEMPRPEHIVWREWWTVTDCDGRLYLAAGYHLVNRLGYVGCDVPWTDADQCRDYRYDRRSMPARLRAWRALFRLVGQQKRPATFRNAGLS